MFYDNQQHGNNGLGTYLGEFKNIKQLREDGWVDDFIAADRANNIYLVLSTEITGYASGIAYEAIPIPELTLKEDPCKQ